jgi:hypothetical protein
MHTAFLAGIIPRTARTSIELRARNVAQACNLLARYEQLAFRVVTRNG